MTAASPAAQPPAEPQLSLPALSALSPDEIEREIERRVATRCQAERLAWRFRLITAEAVMLGLLVGAAGLALNLSGRQTLPAILVVSATCFASGILLLCLSGAWLRLRVWARRGTRP